MKLYPLMSSFFVSLLTATTLLIGAEPYTIQPYDRSMAPCYDFAIDMHTYTKGETEKEFKSKLKEYGFVLLLNAISPETIDDMYRALNETYESAEKDESLEEAEKQNIRNSHINEKIFNKYTGRSLLDLFNDPLQSLGKDFFSGSFRVNERTYTRRVKPPKTKDHKPSQLPLKIHTDGMYHGAETFILNFWTPLEDCGLDKPTLLVFQASPEHTYSLLEFDENTRTFDTETVASVENGTAPFLKELPCYYFILNKGDLVVICNWTLHSGYANETMELPRLSLELRISGIHFWYD